MHIMVKVLDIFCVFIWHMNAYIYIYLGIYIYPCAHMEGKRFAYLNNYAALHNA